MNRAKLWLAVLTANRYTWSATALLVVLVAALFSAYSFAADARDWSRHAYAVRKDFFVLGVAVADAGAAARGAVVAGADGYADDFAEARVRCREALGRLKELTADNPTQQARLTGVDVEVTTKLGDLDQMVRLARDGRPDQARALFASGISRRVHARLAVMIRDCADEEDRLADSREWSARWYSRLALLMTAGGGLAVGAVLVQWVGEYRKLDAPPAPPPSGRYPVSDLFRRPIPPAGGVS